MSQITIGGITLDFKDSSFTGDQWEQVASWVLNGGAQSIAENAQIASEKAAQAAASAESVENTASLSESYAVGGTGTRDGEDTDNAKYYKEQAEATADGLNTASINGSGHLVYVAANGALRDLGQVVGSDGSSIQSIERTSGTGAPGTVDTYTITLTDGSTTTFQVYNGKDGTGTGDMTKAVYDPTNKAQDVFSYADDKAGAVQTNLETHANNANIHVTAAEKTTWDNKADSDDIPTKLSDLSGDSTHRVVSDAEKSTWNGKADKSVSAAATLTAAGWSDGVQTLTVSAVTAAANGSLRIAQSATDEQFAAWGAAQPRVTAQAAGTLTVKAAGTVPAINIPVEVVIV